MSLSHVWLFVTPWTVVHGILPARILEWVASLLQGIFPTQGSTPGLRHYKWILYQLSQKGSPRILEWVVHPFTIGSSRPRNRTGVSCIAGSFFTNWAWGIKYYNSDIYLNTIYQSYSDYVLLAFICMCVCVFRSTQFYHVYCFLY